MTEKELQGLFNDLIIMSSLRDLVGAPQRELLVLHIRRTFAIVKKETDVRGWSSAELRSLVDP